MKTCQSCLNNSARERAEKKGVIQKEGNKENMPATSGEHIIDHQDINNTSMLWPTVSWNIFCSLLEGGQDSAFELSAFVQAPDGDPLREPMTRKEFLQIISQVIKEKTGYRFK